MCFCCSRGLEFSQNTLSDGHARCVGVGCNVFAAVYQARFYIVACFSSIAGSFCAPLRKTHFCRNCRGTVVALGRPKMPFSNTSGSDFCCVTAVGSFLCHWLPPLILLCGILFRMAPQPLRCASQEAVLLQLSGYGGGAGWPKLASGQSLWHCVLRWRRWWW